jgi:hypothetical protein
MIAKRCIICKYYDVERLEEPFICEECKIKLDWKTYTVIIPITGYYEWTGIAESEKMALEEGESEIKTDYEPVFVTTEVGKPKITNIESENFIKEELEYLKELG